MKILSGTSNLKLSKHIAKNLKLKLINTNIRRFADGEIYIEINENIRGNSVFVIQSTSNPANDNLMELLLVIDALKRSSAKTITAVIPYFGYARQDRKVAPRTSISDMNTSTSPEEIFSFIRFKSLNLTTPSILIHHSLLTFSTLLKTGLSGSAKICVIP